MFGDGACVLICATPSDLYDRLRDAPVETFLPRWIEQGVDGLPEQRVLKLVRSAAANADQLRRQRFVQRIERRLLSNPGSNARHLEGERIGGGGCGGK